jgi:alcohol dehydrogenase class IV
MVGFVTAPAIAWGTGALEQLSGLGAHRAVLVVDPAVAEQEGPHRAAEELERVGTTVTVLADANVGTHATSIGELARRLRSLDPDWVVAIGGGTTIDAAKGARLLAERPELSLDNPPVEPALPESPRSHLAAIPTTSGSGAEVSWCADLLTDDGVPIEFAHRSLVPDWAIVDPVFVRALPSAELIAGAFEAAALAAEAYLSAWSNPFSDALAVDALRTVLRRLPQAIRWSDEAEARPALQYAATSAGLAASNAQRGLGHALARALVRPTGLSYARLLTVVLPSVLEFDRPGARERLESLDEILRAPEESAPAPLATRLRRLAVSVGTATSLAGAGASVAALDHERERVVAETLRSPAVLANPRVPSRAELEQLIDGLVGATTGANGRPGPG